MVLLNNLKRIFTIIGFCSLISSCGNSPKVTFTEKEYYENGEKVKGRFVNDSIKDGVFYYYYRFMVAPISG